MMKKQYFAPEMEVVEINYNQQLLAGSVVGRNVIDDFAEPDIPGMAPDMGILDCKNPWGIDYE